MSQSDFLEDLIEEYRRAIDPFHSAEAVAEWAIKAQHYSLKQEYAIRLLTAKISAHMGQARVSDPKGRKVRTHFAVPGENGGMLWAGMSAPRKHKVTSLKYRRKLMVDDAFQLKQDTDSLNDSFPNEKPLQLSLDLTMDVAILEREKQMNPRGLRKGRKPSKQPSQHPGQYQRPSSNAH